MSISSIDRIQGTALTGFKPLFDYKTASVDDIIRHVTNNKPEQQRYYDSVYGELNSLWHGPEGRPRVNALKEQVDTLRASNLGPAFNEQLGWLHNAADSTLRQIDLEQAYRTMPIEQIKDQLRVEDNNQRWLNQQSYLDNVDEQLTELRSKGEAGTATDADRIELQQLRNQVIEIRDDEPPLMETFDHEFYGGGMAGLLVKIQDLGPEIEPKPWQRG